MKTASTEPGRLTIFRAQSDDDLREIRALFLEYQRWLNLDLCFQGFDEELEKLPGRYAPPKGSLLLARYDDSIVGCVAMRPQAVGICEMKRLFVRPAWHGHGIGRKLASDIVTMAREAGYEKMRLDTLDTLDKALLLYGSMGFREISAYCHNPLDSVKYLELVL